MKYLEDRIRAEGKVLPGDVLKVGHFVNQQIDIELLSAMAKEFARMYRDEGVTKVMTIEASGIAIAAAVALEMKVPMVFAKKQQSSNVSGDVYTAKVVSYTHHREYDVTVPVDYLSVDDRVLGVDDFLAQGCALRGLIKIIRDSGASLAGCGILIEKGFQPGGQRLRAEGIRVDSLAVVSSMNGETGEITFA